MLCRRRQHAFTLIELLIVLALMAVLVGLALPNAQATLKDQLDSAAQILRADLEYARTLAVTNGDTYRVVFDFAETRDVLEYTGSNTNLQTLPASAFRDSSDPSDKYSVDLDGLPNLGMPVRIVAAATCSGATVPTDRVEFGPLGSTTAGDFTLIWLGAGTGSAARYYKLAINPATGVVLSDPRLGFTAAPPPSGVMP